jgi:hypothetical protein
MLPFFNAVLGLLGAIAFLAADRVLPGDHVHGAGQGGAGLPQVGRAAGAQRRRARRVTARRGGLGC